MKQFFMRLLIGLALIVLTLFLHDTLTTNIRDSKTLSAKLDTATIDTAFVEINSDSTLQNNLVYDSDTKIIYFKSADSLYSPYYSSEGRLCRYEDGKIVVVRKNNTIFSLIVILLSLILLSILFLPYHFYKFLIRLLREELILELEQSYTKEQEKRKLDEKKGNDSK